MGRITRENYFFVTWKGDHSPRHVHVFKDGKLIVKWDLENDLAMKGRATRRPPLKIRHVSHNNQKREFLVTTYSGQELSFPFAKTDPEPIPENRLHEVFVDAQLAKEAFTYVLESGDQGAVHIDSILEYNRDPKHLADLVLYKLTLEAQKRVEESPLSKREIIRRLGTSATQFYRLLDQTNYRKSIKQLVALLHVLGFEVSFSVDERQVSTSS